jgi:Dyp-type peroxidase family
MAQAKGVLPRGDDKDVLYKNPRTCGYFIGVKLDPALDRARLEVWLSRADAAIAGLVERLPRDGNQEKGDKVAAVAVGLAPSFFLRDGQPRFDPPVPPPAAFRAAIPNAVAGQPDLPNPLPASGPLAQAPTIDADVMFYVASVFEARVNAFISELAAGDEAQALTLERGYQRTDGTEPFGYRDGLRNIARAERPRFVFVDREHRQIEEPAWAEGGTYMAYLKILQLPDAFAALADDAARDATIGRKKSGERLDLVGQGIDPKDEPPAPPPNLPAGAHVGKAGPRGDHDNTQIFRRGLPFIEVGPDGRVRVGLNFCSFQASLDQFDVVLNDWIMNPRFPNDGSGRDTVLDPDRQGAVTSLERLGFYFVPPYDARGLAAAVLGEREEPKKPREGLLVVRKRIVDDSDDQKRFERRGFVFQIVDAQNEPVGGQFSSDSTGRAVAPEKLTIGSTYTLTEISSPVPNVTPVSIQFEMDKANKELLVVNHVPAGTPYGS